TTSQITVGEYVTGSPPFVRREDRAGPSTHRRGATAGCRPPAPITGLRPAMGPVYVPTENLIGKGTHREPSPPVCGGYLCFTFVERLLIARGCYGTNSSAPMSQPAPVGRGSPSKSVVGAPMHVPVSMQGEPGMRCMSFGDTKSGSALMLPPTSVIVPPDEAPWSRTSAWSSPTLS